MYRKYIRALIINCVLAASLAACNLPDTKPGPIVIGALAPEQSSTLTVDVCHNQTTAEIECKDCCDILSDGSGRKTCRDACVGHDFSVNSNLLSIKTNSILGAGGDYSTCAAADSGAACETCCDTSSTLQSGDRRFCRDTCRQQPNKTNDIPTPVVNNPTKVTALTASALLPVVGNYQFTEGPATDTQGNVYFSDINAGRIYKWTPDGKVNVFIDGLKGPNGLMFDRDGSIIACEGGNGRLVSIDSSGKLTVLVDQYNQKRFNEPNDLWIDPLNGIYFTDPAFQSPKIQDGEDVYYIAPDHNQVLRVITDMVRPNGIIGSADGKTLYVSDYGAGQTFTYAINPDGTLTSKKLFTPLGSDGMTLDASGNLYLTTPNKVQVFDATGKHLLDIPTPENPTNVTFGGSDLQTLLITARTAVYTAQIQVEETQSKLSPDPSDGSSALPGTGGFTLSSPAVGADGKLPVEYTCDGNSAAPPLAWTGAPAETKGFAVIMHHVASPEDVHWYWVLYDIPADVTSLVINSSGIGTAGTNSVNKRMVYAPPCSKGPGDKVYTITVYALSGKPQINVPASEVNREKLLEAIQSITLGSAELKVTYARK